MAAAFEKICSHCPPLRKISLKAVAWPEATPSHYKLGEHILEDKSSIVIGEQLHKKKGRVESVTYYFHRSREDANYIGFTIGNQGARFGKCLEICGYSSDGKNGHKIFDDPDMASGARDRILKDFLVGLAEVFSGQEFGELLSQTFEKVDWEEGCHAVRRDNVKLVRPCSALAMTQG